MKLVEVQALAETLKMAAYTGG